MGSIGCPVRRQELASGVVKPRAGAMVGEFLRSVPDMRIWYLRLLSKDVLISGECPHSRDRAGD